MITTGKTPIFTGYKRQFFIEKNHEPGQDHSRQH